jgi:hypothetical protein
LKTGRENGKEIDKRIIGLAIVVAASGIKKNKGMTTSRTV